MILDSLDEVEVNSIPGDSVELESQVSDDDNRLGEEETTPTEPIEVTT